MITESAESLSDRACSPRPHDTNKNADEKTATVIKALNLFVFMIVSLTSTCKYCAHATLYSVPCTCTIPSSRSSY